MTIKNQTAVILNIGSDVINPKDSAEVSEAMFNTCNVHSEIGSCVIWTEYGKRSFENFGKLIAREGIKEIIISSAD